MGTLVTGAAGFVGRHLVTRLLEENDRVRILTRGNRQLPAHWGTRVEVALGDLCDPATLLSAVEGCETVYHLAGEIRNPLQMESTNVQGTRNLLAACRQQRVEHVVYLSSVGVMGATGKSQQLDETNEVAPRGPYETSKYVGEQLVLQSHQPKGMQVSVLRPSIVFGEGERRGPDRFLSFVRAVRSKRFVLFSEDYISSYIYVGDVVAACLAVISSPDAAGEVYIVNEPVPLDVFVDEIASILGVRNPPVLPPPVGAIPEGALRLVRRFQSLYNRTVFSGDKLLSLGFALPFGYREGLRRTILWYQERGLLCR